MRLQGNLKLIKLGSERVKLNLVLIAGVRGASYTRMLSRLLAADGRGSVHEPFATMRVSLLSFPAPSQQLVTAIVLSVCNVLYR